MGSLNSSTKQDTQSAQSQTNPWSVQAPYLTQGFQAASNALGQAQGATPPPGFVAQFTPDQLSAFQSMLSFGTNNGQIAASSANAGNALTGAGAGATSRGLFDLANFQPSATTRGILNSGAAYANNPQTEGMIAAATRDATRAATEQALPQIARNAAGSGNTNSSRTGVAEGIVQRGLGDTVGDISSQIRGDQYNRGISTALSQLQGNDATRLGALGALTSGGTSAVGTGVGANSGAVAQQGGLFDIANTGIAGQQAGAQAALNDAMQKYQFQTSSPFSGLNNFWNIVGGQNYGSSSTGSGTSTSTSTPSWMSTIGGLIGAGGSFAGRNGLNLFPTPK